VNTTPQVAAVATSVWMAAGLVGDGLLLAVLRRMPGVRYLRIAAGVVAVVYPLFLLVPGAPAKMVLLGFLGLLNSGWYAIPQAALYDAVPGGSGIVLTIENAGSAIGILMPLLIGVVAGAAGLQVALWILLLAPVAMLALLPRGEHVDTPPSV
jgi:MFS transporter, FSR family, fosmidomycin resistance protein